MKNKKPYNIKNILLAALWVVIGTGTVVFLVAAIQKKDSKQCKGIDISISGASNNFFIDKSDIKKIITWYNTISVLPLFTEAAPEPLVEGAAAPAPDHGGRPSD